MVNLFIAINPHEVQIITETSSAISIQEKSRYISGGQKISAKAIAVWVLHATAASVADTIWISALDQEFADASQQLKAGAMSNTGKTIKVSVNPERWTIPIKVTPKEPPTESDE